MSLELRRKPQWTLYWRSTRGELESVGWSRYPVAVMRRTLIRLVLIVTAMVVCLVIACLLTGGSQDSRTNIAYWAWRAHVGPFSLKYASVIRQDSSHWLGMPVEDFRARVGRLYEGASFPRKSYRGDFAWERRGLAEAYYWFDDDPGAWGECVIVKDGCVSGFVSVKG